MNEHRSIKAPTGTKLRAKSWLTEAPLRMLMNNLDPEVAERPEDLVVYGGIGKAARNWDAYDAIIRALTLLESDETLLVQSGKPVGVFRTHADALSSISIGSKRRDCIVTTLPPLTIAKSAVNIPVPCMSGQAGSDTRPPSSART